MATRGTKVRRPIPGKAPKATPKSLGKAKALRAKTATRKTITPPYHRSISLSRTVSPDDILEIPLPD